MHMIDLPVLAIFLTICQFIEQPFRSPLYWTFILALLCSVRSVTPEYLCACGRVNHMAPSSGCI